MFKEVTACVKPFIGLFSLWFSKKDATISGANPKARTPSWSPFNVR
jgi:hypothetical protein